MTLQTDNATRISELTTGTRYLFTTDNYIVDGVKVGQFVQYTGIPTDTWAEFNKDGIQRRRIINCEGLPNGTEIRLSENND